jgi:hypothetical protein
VSGKVFDTKKHSNIKRRAEYRRINKYIKSPEQAKREKTRRMRVLELWLKDWGIGRIASDLGVSKRTVDRDLDKLGETIKRRFDRSARAAAEEERLQMMRQLEGLSPVEQAKRINRELVNAKRFGVRRECHKLLVRIDVGAFNGGKNALSFKPKFAALVAPYVINFQLVVDGDCRGIGQLRVE